MVTLLDGKNLSEEILGKAKAQIEYMLKKPKLAVILTGND